LFVRAGSSKPGKELYPFGPTDLRGAERPDALQIEVLLFCERNLGKRANQGVRMALLTLGGTASVPSQILIIPIFHSSTLLESMLQDNLSLAIAEKSGSFNQWNNEDKTPVMIRITVYFGQNISFEVGPGGWYQ
jgi:hypothetical protein